MTAPGPVTSAPTAANTLAWQGKVGLVFGATGVIDALLCRHWLRWVTGFYLAAWSRWVKGQYRRALKHVGPLSKQMRKNSPRR